MDIFAPDHAEWGRPYWWDDGAPLPDLPEVPNEKADLVIIGAGFTGLSAAIAAHDAGAKVIVIDAGVPGEGASTRNGGMFGAHPRLPYSTMVKRFGEATARGVYAEANSSFHFVRDLIAREDIDCGYQQTGRIQLAWTKAHFDAQRELVRSITSVSDLQMELVERHALGSHIETDRYFGGILFKGHAGLHPRQFHDGLLAAALQRGVEIVQNCPVTNVEQQRSGFCVHTSRQKVQTSKVVMATNGYTTGPFSWFQRRVFPLPSYLIATEELSDNLLGQLVPGRHMMVETRARHSYYRLAPDGRRILFGGRAAMVPTALATAAARLRQTMCEVWPALEDVRLTHVWTGNTGYTFNHMPHVGVHNGLHYAMGYSGSGVAMAPYLGMKAAYQALGDARGETAYSQTHLKTSFLHPFATPHFLQAADRWYHLVVDRAETNAERKDQHR